MEIFQEPIARYIWDTKYRYRLHGVIKDQTIEDTWRRVAKAVANVESRKSRSYWAQAFYQLLENFQFLPGGRILTGAGTEHSVTLLNCFVMPLPEDSLISIFSSLEKGALTLQMGGGIGYDFSILRPKGTLVKKSDSYAAGPVSFMRIWDAMCKTLLTTGSRRGAMMGVLRCDHPDIEEFIEAKKNPAELRHFNVSVLVTDRFMAAVKNNEDWPLIFPLAENETAVKQEVIEERWGNPLLKKRCLIYKTIKARKLWQKIIRAAYDYAEPGVLFYDTINRYNNLWYCETISATNPCGEIPLPPNGACNLGAINLTQFVMNPFSSEAKIAWDRLEKCVQIATRFLDNVLDISQYPLKSERDMAFNTRRIGLGVTGLANLFVMLNVHYGSKASLILADELMNRIKHITWQTSIDLAKEKNVFPYFEKKYLKSAFVQTLETDLKKSLQKYGVRNSHHNAIAPTGTISLLANNVANGIEPIFRAEYDRHVLTETGHRQTFKVKDYTHRLLQTLHRTSNAWSDAETMNPLSHLKMQAIIQAHMDNAISKTINLPVDFPFEKLTNLYTKAHQLKLKGCTIFRPNEITGNVLSAAESECCQQE